MRAVFGLDNKFFTTKMQKYRIMKARTAGEMEKLINLRLEGGWRVAGSPTIVTDSHGITSFYQAVTMEEVPRVSKRTPMRKL